MTHGRVTEPGEPHQPELPFGADLSREAAPSPPATPSRTGYRVSQPDVIGNVLAVDESVLTASGWIRAGDLTLGVPVIDSDGTPVEVTRVVSLGLQPAYRVAIGDGSIVCGEEQLF